VRVTFDRREWHWTVVRSLTRPPAYLLTIDEVAGALCIGRTKVYELVRDGHLEAVSIGRCRRVSIAALERFVASLELIHPRRSVDATSPDVIRVGPLRSA
jgi:excisionase family DNA binding protein